MVAQSNKPELSIVIITKNEEKYLLRVLNSIKKQKFKDYEIIVADYNSTDNTRHIALANRCCVVQGGLPPVARNNGAKAARGDYILFLDADVVLPDDFLPYILNKLKIENAGLAVFCARPIDGRPLDAIGFWLWNFLMRVFLRLRPLGNGHCVLVRSELHKKLKGFDISLSMAEDIDYFRRASESAKLILICDRKVYMSMRRFKARGYFKLGLKMLFSTLLCLIFWRPKIRMRYF